jgi:hypothetical protein
MPVWKWPKERERFLWTNQRVLELDRIASSSGLKRAGCLEKLEHADERLRQSNLKPTSVD